MTQRIVLTIAQARTLQRSGMPWPAQWAFMLTEQREQLDRKADDDRMALGMAMKARGCGEDQIAEQLSWIPNSLPVRQINKLHKLLTLM